MKLHRRMARMRDWFLELDILGAFLVLLIGTERLQPKAVPVRVRRR